MRREMKVGELKALDSARQRFMNYQQSVKEIHLQRLDDEIRRKVLQRDQETKAALNEIEIQALELETQKGALEQSLMRKHEEALQRLQTERQAIFHQDEVEAAMVQKGLAEQGKMEREKIRKQQTKLAKAQATRGGLSMEQQVNLLKDVQGMRRELQQAEIGEKLQERELAEKQLQATIKALRREEELDTASKMRGLKSTHVHQHAHDETRLRTLRAMRDSSEYTLSSSLTDSTPLTVGSELSVSDMPSTGHNASSSTLSASVSAWASRREELDRQEADLLYKVQELRQRVAKGSTSQSTSSSSYSQPDLVQPTTT